MLARDTDANGRQGKPDGDLPARRILFVLALRPNTEDIANACSADSFRTVFSLTVEIELIDV
jgi:hypothetical protein